MELEIRTLDPKNNVIAGKIKVGNCNTRQQKYEDILREEGIQKVI